MYDVDNPEVWQKQQKITSLSPAPLKTKISLLNDDNGNLVRNLNNHQNNVNGFNNKVNNDDNGDQNLCKITNRFNNDNNNDISKRPIIVNQHQQENNEEQSTKTPSLTLSSIEEFKSKIADGPFSLNSSNNDNGNETNLIQVIIAANNAYFFHRMH